MTAIFLWLTKSQWLIYRCFYKIIAALKDGATLIMLGDKDQLCSVESGAVLGDICAKLSDSDTNAVSESRCGF